MIESMQAHIGMFRSCVKPNRTFVSKNNTKEQKEWARQWAQGRYVVEVDAFDGLSFVDDSIAVQATLHAKGIKV